MTTDEIRELFTAFFTQRDHTRLPSAPLVPRDDPSTLLISAGMHPLKPYFLGQETPPSPRLTSCQKCFRAVDIDQIGLTHRHLTFFEMLGNFSMGDYFKQGAVEFAWDFSLNGFGFKPEQVWVTVFEGDDALGLGPDQEAIDAWLSVGVARDRIVELPRSENFWQAGPTGPCGPCSELYFDRGLDFGGPDDLPGGENERFLEYWNLVFMQYDNQGPAGGLVPLPHQNIDTGLGLNRLAALLQGTTSVFETDQVRPLIDLGESLSGRRYGADAGDDRALRILADHLRGASFLIADGVVPSNEERGYVLRRLMRRAIVQGRRLGIDPGFLPRYADVVRDTMASAYPELHQHAGAVDRWMAGEEESFGKTIEQGTKLLDDLVARAQDAGLEGIGAAEAFQLHDTYGFPFDLTLELAAESGLGVDAQGFETLMDAQRDRSRSGAGGRGGRDEVRERAQAWVDSTGTPSEFVGYATTDQPTAVAGVSREDGRTLVKLVESPFYAAGGGQISDVGTLESADGDCRAKVTGVLRLGDDQAVVVELEHGELGDGERVTARVDRALRRATECNHTATHLLHAALRERLGDHVHQAGSAVGPEKLRFDFTHGGGLSADDVRAVEDRVNAEILAGHRVRALTTTLDEAKALGAMALFGEKYGDVVRMVEVGDGSWSRELCGGTHVRSTAEIGVFKLVVETSSAANVRRIEAVTGPAAVALLRRHDSALVAAAALLRTTPDQVVETVERREAARRELERQVASGAVGGPAGGVDVEALASQASDVGGAKVLCARVEVASAKALPEVVDHLRNRLGEASAIVLGAAVDGKVALIVAVSDSVVARGVKAGEIVKLAAGRVGGGGGGRDTMAQAGGRDPERLDEALMAARAEIESRLA